MSKDVCTLDYFYVDGRAINKIHELEEQAGNPFVARSTAGCFNKPHCQWVGFATYGWPFYRSENANCSKTVVKE